MEKFYIFPIFLFLTAADLNLFKAEELIDLEYPSAELDAPIVNYEITEASEVAALDTTSKSPSYEVRVSLDDDRCSESICRNFLYPNSNEVVYFERQPKTMYTRSSTAKTIEEDYSYGVLTFVESVFRNFPLNLFYVRENLEELDLRNCSITNMNWENFLMADKLKILLLSGNQLHTLNEATFNYASNLSFLFLDNNQLQHLDENCFEGLTQLYMLDLRNNALESIPDKTFHQLKSLQALSLAGNRLTVVSNVLFAQNPHLMTISLQSNNLHLLEDYSFQYQEHLRILDVSDNKPLKSLIIGNTNIESLWARNCSINRLNVYGTVKYADLQQNRIKELYFIQPNYLETLILRDNDLVEISSLMDATNLRVFDVSNNPQLQGYPDLWQTNALQRLDMSNTSTKEIPMAVITDIPNLHSLDISYNMVEEIDPKKFKYLQHLTHFYIHGNQWNCYNLQLLMDLLIKPFEISYIHDEFNSDFPGEYIQGIKCMYRSQQPLETTITPSNDHLYLQRQTLTDSTETNRRIIDPEFQLLRNELKTIVGFYERKFNVIFNRLHEMEERLKSFEIFNKTMWQHITLMV